MRHYLPNTEEDLHRMLETIGVQRIEDLFASIPEKLRLTESLRLPPSLSEPELISYMKRVAKKNGPLSSYTSFLGGGAYHHYIPAIVPSLLSRSEFLTCYTPYQPELSQGTLQSIFEYQTLICQLTGMEVSNASLYEGATALVEAVLMSHRINRRPRVLISEAVHPEYRMVLKTYCKNIGIELTTIPFDQTGLTDKGECGNLIDHQTSALVVQYPNFFGRIEPLEALAPMARSAGSLLMVVVTEPISLGLLKPPGELGADIVIGEGQSFGNPLNYGGPYLGFIATRSLYQRNLPGRLVGQTKDSQGRRGFVLTLATREQHIRREKATSNICTNEALCALAATIYLCALGKKGLREVAHQNLQKAAYAKDLLSGLKRCRVKFEGATFNEFVLQLETPPEEVNRALLQERIIGGLPLKRWYPELSDCLLTCVTEVVPKRKIDRLAAKLEELL